jgi:hypothetical protein
MRNLRMRHFNLSSLKWLILVVRRVLLELLLELLQENP